MPTVNFARPAEVARLLKYLLRFPLFFSINVNFST